MLQKRTKYLVGFGALVVVFIALYIVGYVRQMPVKEVQIIPWSKLPKYSRNAAWAHISAYIRASWLKNPERYFYGSRSKDIDLLVGKYDINGLPVEVQEGPKSVGIEIADKHASSLKPRNELEAADLINKISKIPKNDIWFVSQSPNGLCWSYGTNKPLKHISVDINKQSVSITFYKEIPGENGPAILISGKPKPIRRW